MHSQFLPQDRVVEFAHMGPQILLKETQRAVGATHLAKYQDKLIEYSGEEKNVSRRLADAEERYKQGEQRTEVLERDVQRFMEREEILKRIRVLEAGLPLARYKDVYQKRSEATEVRNKAKEEVTRLKQMLTPVVEKIKRFHSEIKEDEIALHESLQNETEFVNTWSGLEKDFKEVQKKIYRLKDDEKAVFEQHRRKQHELKKMKISAEELQAHIAKGPPVINQTQFVEELVSTIYVFPELRC